ncbi:MAG: PilZ domain-containing protein [Candidatus Eremiobacteraeota bacterium]|nr:PilZ domain-containing protein [Candidatus Eremiobacteraeota bacterium]MBC5828547.1 PilZ domain-containing protein [Candidatus Eremiobacteraeota bacterium]
MSDDLQRRQYVRVVVSFPVEFALENEPSSHWGSMLDLGAGGMRLVSSHDLPARSIIKLKFGLPGTERTMELRGVIVLSFFTRTEQKFHHGIAFTSIDPHDRLAISEFVENRALERGRETK